ncbi:MAG: 3-isopropylmalate dehydratase large subunit [Euryarchaeota archaeon]|nr:3-isopropylmalate dehydratase large subunit [Euryarchaeota archaeon]
MSRTKHTIAEKILASKSGRARVVPGEIIEAKVDVAMAHEALAQVVDPFKRMGAGKVWAPERVVVPIDHWVPASTESAARLHKACREFVNQYGIPNFYDVGRQGICHQILVEEGFVLPGDLVVGTDSHTNMAGALGSFACGIGPTEMAAVFSTGDIWLRVPETMRMNVTGRLHFPVSSKDLVLKIIGTIGDDGARYRAVEFTGKGIAAMEMWERFTLTNMTTEMGAKAGIVPPDAETARYLAGLDVKNGRRGEIERNMTLKSDEGATFRSDLQFDLDSLEPQVALPSSPENVKAVKDVETGQVDQVFIGSCTNARLEDLRIVANILRGSKVKRGTRLVVFPASTSIYNQCLREGIIDIIVDAGGIFNAASCGACFGGMGGVLAGGETCISTSNRNYVGRMGHAQSKSYLVSPATAAASAIDGKLIDPREYVTEGDAKRILAAPMARR